jgi:hypothetical protein
MAIFGIVVRFDFGPSRTRLQPQGRRSLIIERERRVFLYYAGTIIRGHQASFDMWQGDLADKTVEKVQEGFVRSHPIGQILLSVLTTSSVYRPPNRVDWNAKIF